MSKLLSSRSYVLFLLLGLCFFSCEQLKEIIKPTHPQPVADTCRIKTENGKEYLYDLEGKLVAIRDYYLDGAGGSFPLIFKYNQNDQVIQYDIQGGNNPFYREFAYDSLRRLQQSSHTIELVYVTINHNYTYKKDTILIDNVAVDEYDTVGHSQTVLLFKNDNLVRAYQMPSETSQTSFDYTYTYTNTLNRLRNQKKPLLFLFEDDTNPLMSKQLPASRRNTAGEDQGTITYNWQLNEQGYPVNNGLSNQVVYTYECEE
jgi:hypothetical protein